MRHIDRVTFSSSSRRRLCGATAGVMLTMAPAGIAAGAPGDNSGSKSPGRPTAPAVPTVPGAPVPPGQGGDRPGGDRPGGDRPGAGDRPGPAVSVPRGVPTSGLAAGSGALQIREYVDLGSLRDARAHQRIAPVLLQQLATGELGSILLRPLIMGRDANSTEAASALIAAARQNRAWFLSGHLARARTTRSGDWITPRSLRSIGRAIGGLAVTRFVRDATGRSAYPELNNIRREARAARVRVTPAFVVKGPGGTRVVTNPASASEVIAAIGEVRSLQ